MRFVVLIAMLSFVYACSSRALPKDIIPPEKMKPLLYDIVRADEMVNNYAMRDTALKANEQRLKLYEQVFLINKTNHDEFFKSFKYYQAHPNVNKALFDSLISYATKQQNAIYKARDSIAK